VTDLSDLELDALTELVNLGVSRAAANLSEMVTEQVYLSVPKVLMVSREQAIDILNKSEPSRLVAVHQIFDGDLSGRALVIFPEAKSLELVRAVTSADLSLEDIVELEHEALAETGNVILNSCLATVANLLDRTLKISLPDVLRGDGHRLFNLPPPPQAGDVVMFVYINFAVHRRDIQGYIALMMDVSSLTALKGLLAEFIQRISGEPMMSPNAS
jgi:chemotaxis protein CheC